MTDFLVYWRCECGKLCPKDGPEERRGKCHSCRHKELQDLIRKQNRGPYHVIF